MKEMFRRGVCIVACSMLAVGLAGTSAWADGSEALGPPSVTLGTGTGIVVAGTGAETQPASFDINVPGNVVQALLYWAGEGNPTGDDTIDVEILGTTYPTLGTLIGGPTYFYTFGGPVYNRTYRADITPLISSGMNTLTVSGIDYVVGALGAGLLVIYEDGDTNVIDLRDGQDLAFARFAPPLNATVPQTFTFAATAYERTAEVSMFFGSVGADAVRPNLIRFSTDAGDFVEYQNLLSSVDGPLWDTVREGVTVSAGATSLTVEAISWEDGSGRLPASFTWVAAGVAIAPDPCLDVDCDDDNLCTTEECIDGECVYTTITCDDGDACTDDICDPAVGCVYTEIVCDDGDACTTDECVDGECVFTEIVCDDGDACTRDACVDGECVFTEIMCDDGDACTTDACVDGICVYTEIMCDDGDACTTDECVDGICVYTEIMCDDGDACTTDECVDGICVYTEIMCDDGDLCTTDECVDGECVYTEIICDDDDPCTDDYCMDGECVYEDNGTCQDFYACTPGFWRQEHWYPLWPAPFMPADDFDTTFGVDLFDPDITLGEAIRAKGGGLGKLARHGTAALLNAAALEYPMTVDEVIAAVQSVAADMTMLEDVAGDFADYNEMWDCPFGMEDVRALMPGYQVGGGKSTRSLR